MQIAVDPMSIKDQDQYKKDLAECEQVAKSYDLTGTTVTTGVIAGAANAIARVAMAAAAEFFPPAIPFIVAGALGAGAGGVGWGKAKENEAREKIYAECMNQRGYKAYAPK